MKLRIIIAVMLTAIMASGALAARGNQGSAVPGKFDYYVFSLSWQPAFCETHQDKKECKTMQEGDFDTRSLVLHGLWPSKNNDRKHAYGYCNVPQKIRSLDNAANWCNMPFPDLSRTTIATLGTVMPGYQSCLENHEWYKHGVCSGMSADTYFATAARYVEGVASTNLGTFISANVGRSVSLEALAAAAGKDFGAKAAAIRYICQKGILNEVRLYLKKDLPAEGDITADLLVAPDASEKSTCSGTVKIDQAGQQEMATRR